MRKIVGKYYLATFDGQNTKPVPITFKVSEKEKKTQLNAPLYVIDYGTIELGNNEKLLSHLAKNHYDISNDETVGIYTKHKDELAITNLQILDESYEELIPLIISLMNDFDDEALISNPYYHEVMEKFFKSLANRQFIWMLYDWNIFSDTIYSNLLGYYKRRRDLIRRSHELMKMYFSDYPNFRQAVVANKQFTKIKNSGYYGE